MEVKMLKRSILLFAFLLFCVVTKPALAANEAELILGAAAFLDEDIPFDHFLIGASYKLEMTEKFSIKPQFMMLFGPGQARYYAIMGHIVYDLFERENVVLYVSGGAGLLHQRDRFGPGPAFSGNEVIVNGGIGVQIHFSERFFISPEFRIGFEPLFLGTVNIGYSF
jgi:hypothetical protein